jgi:hypothetical protein
VREVVASSFPKILLRGRRGTCSVGRFPHAAAAPALIEVGHPVASDATRSGFGSEETCAGPSFTISASRTAYRRLVGSGPTGSTPGHG